MLYDDFEVNKTMSQILNVKAEIKPTLSQSTDKLGQIIPYSK